LLLSRAATADATSLWDRTREAIYHAWAWVRDEAPQDSFAAVWEGIVPNLQAILALEERHDRLPDSAWLGDDKASNEADINRLLDESIEILVQSNAQRYREKIRELEARAREAHERIAEYRRERVTAPAKGVWRSTAEDYDRRIAELNATIAEYDRELEGLKADFVREIQGSHVDLSDEQLDFLLSTVVGDDLIQIGIAFDNIRTITGQLEQLLIDSQEDLTAARRYYGMYTVLLRILDRMHQRLVEDIDRRYVPEIAQIIERTKVLRDGTRILKQRQPPASQALTANMEAQELTLKAALRYRQYLLAQRAEVLAARQRLAGSLQVAFNTYETVKVSGDLVGLMRSSQKLLDVLASLQVPALRTFENLEMKREFERLTLRLKQDEA
jgi:hypothetical protein